MIPTDDADDDAIFGYADGIPLAAVHPGQTVAAELDARGLTGHRAAVLMRIPANRLGQIIAGKRGIIADTALRLARLLGPGAQFWMNLQAQYDLATTERDHGPTIRSEVPELSRA